MAQPEQLLQQMTRPAVKPFIAQGAMKPIATEAAARLLNGLPLNTVFWIAASEKSKDTLPKTIEAFRNFAADLLR